MANNCCETIHCKKLVTINDMNQMLSLANLDCTNYSSACTEFYSGCCGYIGSSGYSPTYNELTANTGSVHFGHWSSGTIAYDDQDGFDTTNPSWANPSCCNGNTNVPLDDLDFKYTTFSGFTIQLDELAPCAENVDISFNYGLNRKSVYCNGESFSQNTSGITYSNDTPNLNVSKIISAISVTSTSAQTDWKTIDTTSQNRFTGATVGGVTIYPEDIFKAHLSVSTKRSEDCVGVSASSENAEAWIKYMPKFRGCEKTTELCHVYRNGSTQEFTWDTNNPIGGTCETGATPLEYNVETEYVGSYQGVPPQITITLTWIPYEGASAITETVYFDTEECTCDSDYLCGYIYVGEEPYLTKECVNIEYKLDEQDKKLYLKILQNDNTYDKRFDVSISYSNCGEFKSDCSICQGPAPRTISTRGNCCTGLVSLYPVINCGDTVTTANNKARQR